MRIGIMLSMPGDPISLSGLIGRARQAEDAGFSSAWLPQVFSYDALMVLAMAGRETRRIELGTAVVPTYPRHPTALASQALTAQQASSNRIALGIGLSHKVVIENMFGMDYSQPAAHMREYLTVLGGLLGGEQVSFAGEHYRVNARIDVPGAARPPLLVAALGPAMLKLCGRLADGTITWMGGVNYLRDVATPALAASAASAGRASPRIVAMVPVVVTADVRAGRELVNGVFANYGQLPSYRATLDRGGADAPADVAVVCGANELAAGLREFAEAGVTDFVAVIPQAEPSLMASTYDALSSHARRALAGTRLASASD